VTKSDLGAEGPITRPYHVVLLIVHSKPRLIMIIIAPLSILNEYKWGDLECLYKACQSAITNEGAALFRDTGVNEPDENEQQIET